jgi:predicted glycosyltransferase
MKPRVLFYVQHLLGIGHLRRAATLARAMDKAGLAVTVVSGGSAVPGLDIGNSEFRQLPPVRAVDLFFKVLVDENDVEIDDAWRARRAEALMQVWREVNPHVLMFELFPFGRRQMRFELLPLLEAATAAKNRPEVICSVRDILVAQTKPGRNDEMIELVNRYFDHVLLHGDPELIPFDQTFPHAERLGEKSRYTGYVVDISGMKGGPDSPGHDEVIVSAGGGAVGDQLLRTAIEARAASDLKDRTWRLLVGYSVPETEIEALRSLAPEGVIVERARPDFTSLLANCAVSISQGGYNTIMETLHAGAHAVVVPYAGGLETEQTLRARLLSAKGVLHIVDEDKLSPGVLAAAVDKAAKGPPSGAFIDTNGAARSAGLVLEWAGAVAASDVWKDTSDARKEK